MSTVDVIVVGGGGAGLFAACVAAQAGATVAVLEKSPLFGGTTAISGGGLWVPRNHHMLAAGCEDDRDGALAYLHEISRGRTDSALLEAFIDHAPEMVELLERITPVRMSLVDRPDYHPNRPGARAGRALEPQPYTARALGDFFSKLRFSITRGPVTYVESRGGLGGAIVEQRRREGVRAQGAGLIAGVAKGALDLGVNLVSGARVRELCFDGGQVSGVIAEVEGRPFELRARKGVILASGGFEWSAQLRRAFLKSPDCSPITPPWARGEGLMCGLKAGAAVSNMMEAWWCAAVSVPGERYDGHPMFRNVVRELALPGSLLVSSRGERFVNEASGYNEIGQALLAFDPGRYEYANVPAFLVFDDAFKQRYTVAAVPASQPAPDWFLKDEDLRGLAHKAQIDSAALESTVARFNAHARAGRDGDFGRGEDAHSRFNGDARHAPNPCLAPLEKAPYYAVPIHLGVNGTKGGLLTDTVGGVLAHDGSAINGLFACGDAAASIMGPGYAGAGASLGPAFTFAFLAARRCALGE